MTLVDRWRSRSFPPRGAWLPLCLGAGLSASLAVAQGPPPPAAKVVDAAVESALVSPAVTLVATPLPIQRSRVAAAGEGIVVERKVFFSLRYREGDLLLRLDDRVERARRDAAKAARDGARARSQETTAGERPETIAVGRAELRRAEAARREADLHRERISDLHGRKAATREALDEAERRAQVAVADLEAARARLALLEAGNRKERIEAANASLAEHEARLAEAERMVAHQEVRAPFSGAAAEIYVEVGDWVAKGDPIVDLVDDSRLDLVALVPQHQVELLIPMSETPCLQNRRETPVRRIGRLVAIGPRIEEGSRSMPVVVRVDNPDRALQLGASTEVELAIGPPEPTLLLPKDAVLRSGGPPTAYVIEDGKAASRTLKLGREVGRFVQVLDGLKAGERVVVEGNERLRPGSLVEVQRSAPPGFDPASGGTSP